MHGDGETPGSEVTLLKAATALIASAEPEDVAGVLTAVRDGLIAARRCGLVVATDRRWRSRQRNAEAVEYTLAEQLVRAPALFRHEIVLADPPDVTERLSGRAADTAVHTISAFSRAAEQALRAAAEHAPAWGDRSVCRHCTALAREFREAWNGEHPTYSHQPPQEQK
ncbi:hypothetical protein [Amycolatopsis anabasis]|uniref:hypothetical protein n=1 Tax=Amycolatopsis anabasis TaxID=1840409 RepID=UPI00131A7194|nr:hypothetical protein [Amycolatopsis anabasis]